MKSDYAFEPVLLEGTLDEVVEKVIRGHVPDEEAPHWANERRCRGCGEFIHLYIAGGFPHHQAKVIGDYIRGSLGCR